MKIGKRQEILTEASGKISRSQQKGIEKSAIASIALFSRRTSGVHA
jgi:hypothetical protein